MSLKLKTVQTNNLDEWYEDNRCQVNAVDIKRDRERRFRDTLLRILASEDAKEELQEFLKLAMECFAADRIYPIPADAILRKKITVIDLEDARKAMDLALNGSYIPYKKMMIFVALGWSQSFVRQFCPPPSNTRSTQFLANAELMHSFAGAPGRHTKTPTPLQTKISHLATSNLTVTSFNGDCFRIWSSGLEKSPWEDYEQWSSQNSNAMGTDVSNAIHFDAHTKAALENGQGLHLLLTDGGGGGGGDFNDE
jgi:hypothetical protein